MTQFSLQKISRDPQNSHIHTPLGTNKWIQQTSRIQDKHTEITYVLINQQ
jgi:hypothetical protein